MTSVKASGLWVCRHAESEANRLGIIVSDPALGCSGFGLSLKGQDQVKNASLPNTSEQVRLVSSDFLRAKETAQLLQKRVPGAVLSLAPELRERNFAAYEGQPSTEYEKVWSIDALRQNHPGVETVIEVWQRASNLARRYQLAYPDDCIIFVAHGDVLQILEAGWCLGDPWLHRSLPPLANAELRKLGNICSSSFMS